MTKQDQINFIREKCIEANDEIVRFGFGNEIEMNETHRHFTVALMDDSFIRVFSGTNQLVDVAPEDCKILGRPIRLADVLLAIGSRAKDFELRNDYLWSWSVDVPKYNDDRANQIFWNLRADDVREQSEETINFIYNLLK